MPFKKIETTLVGLNQNISKVIIWCFEIKVKIEVMMPEHFLANSSFLAVSGPSALILFTVGPELY